MNILVTGGSGRIGRCVVKDLVTAGHRVLSVDVQAPEEPVCDFRRVDLTQAGEVYQALKAVDAEAVIHLGAWPNAKQTINSRTYGDNVRGAFHVFQACADLGAGRVVYASSGQVYGLAERDPLYLPLDEDHPLRPVNCYALSKTAAEQAGAYFVETRGITVLSLRFVGVRRAVELESEVPAMRRDPAASRRILWTLLDARDAAVACRLAVEKESAVSGPYNIAGAIVAVDDEPRALVARHFSAGVDCRTALTGRESPISCARAQAAFGWSPRVPVG